MARKGKNTEEQMKLFEEGGLKDEGGAVDPVSGNDVPSGSTQAEVRDDIPAQLSEGEFLLPADVVRYIGLENLMELRNKAKQGLKQMEAMGQMGNSEEATMDDTAEMDVDIDAMIDAFDPNDPETMEFSQGGVVYAQQGALIPGQMPQQQFSYGYRPPQQQAGYQAPQVPTGQTPDYTQFVSAPAQAAVGQGKGATEQRQYIGPNGEMITVMFINGRPQQEIPSGYKVYKPEEAKPEVVAPTVTPVDTGGSDGPQDTGKTAIEIGNELTGKVEDAALNKAKEDLSNFGLKTFGLTAGAMLAGGPGAMFGVAKGREAEYNQLRDNYFKEVSRVAATQNPDKYTEAGLYSRLTNPTTKVLDVAKEGTKGGFTDQTRNTYVDMDGLVRDTSRLSSGAKDALETESRTPSVTPVDYEDFVTDAEVRAAEERTRQQSSTQTTRGKDITAEVREALGQSTDDADSRDSGTGTSASSVGGEDTEAVGSFSEGGAVQQTKRALKSSRKK